LRVGYIHDWKSDWFAEKTFGDFRIEDARVRDHITNKLAHAGLSDITIRNDAAEVEVSIHTARPGIVIGKSGSGLAALRRELHDITGKSITVNILEIEHPELDAKLVSYSIAQQLQNGVDFQRAMKEALTSAMRSGAKGCKIQVGGRLAGAEMARSESYSAGRVPLHTLRADIDYGFYEARTESGRIGVKCWINKGEIIPPGSTGRHGAGRDEDRRGGRGARTKPGKNPGGGAGKGSAKREKGGDAGNAFYPEPSTGAVKRALERASKELEAARAAMSEQTSIEEVGQLFAGEVQGLLGTELPDPETVRRAARLAVAEHAWQQRLGTLLETKDVVELLRISRQRVSALASKQRLVVLSGAGRLLFPAVQFAGTTAEQRSALAKAHNVLVTVGGIDPWSAASWLITNHPELDEHDPISWLRSGGNAPQLLTVAHRDAARAAR